LSNIFYLIPLCRDERDTMTALMLIECKLHDSFNSLADWIVYAHNVVRTPIFKGSKTPSTKILLKLENNVYAFNLY
jgi:hypothetical protein